MDPEDECLLLTDTGDDGLFAIDVEGTCCGVIGLFVPSQEGRVRFGTLRATEGCEAISALSLRGHVLLHVIARSRSPITSLRGAKRRSNLLLLFPVSLRAGAKRRRSNLVIVFYEIATAALRQLRNDTKKRHCQDGS